MSDPLSPNSLTFKQIISRAAKATPEMTPRELGEAIERSEIAAEELRKKLVKLGWVGEPCDEKAAPTDK